MHEHDPIEPQPKRRARGIGTIAAGLALVAAKFKTILALLLQFKFLAFGVKLLASSWTFILSLALYVAFFGWRLGIVIIFVLAAHEMGHYAAYRGYGLQARLPVFIPFFGAYTAGAIAPDLEQDAYIALAGPITGLILAGACYGVGLATVDRFWIACADISAFLNLFNMIPVLPFDGGRVIGAIWPPLWIAGIALFVAAALFLHIPIFLVLIIALMGLPTMLAALRGKVIDPRSATLSNASRARVGVWYLATMLALIVVLGQAQSVMPANNAPL